ncbi:unnamed protein product [Orchesella dallaii]|uniref:Uncharacterized protein n=1 Tax=Orchesella dallaii TaxID=48710 RepID=A0ABP1RUE6_9HEXA
MLIKEEETEGIVSQQGLLKSLSIQLGIEKSHRNRVEELRKTILFKCQSNKDSPNSERVHFQERLDEEIDVKEELESHDEDDEDGFDASDDTNFF